MSYKIDRATLRVARRRKGRYLLRTNLTEADPAKLWEFYVQLTEVEQAFKELKGDLAPRPIYHQRRSRIHAHIFVSFLAYCLQVTLKARLKRSATGLTPRWVLEKFAAIQMLDVHLPTTDEPEIVLTRYTHPEKELSLLLDQFIAAAGEITRRAKKPVSPETLMAFLLEVEADPIDIADLHCFHVPRRSRAERDKSWR